MPALKRQSGADAAVELKAWRMTFKSGYDFLRALPRIGVEISGRHEPNLDVAREAWVRLGDAFLETVDAGASEPWALRTFGEPSAAARRRTPRGKRR